MPNFTRIAIKASFLKLLSQQPLSKISVRDIVEDCGINRNSFYYHFHDIPALIEEIVKECKELIIRFLKCELFGVGIDWMNSGMPSTITEDAKRIFEICHGLSCETIQRCGEVT